MIPLKGVTVLDISRLLPGGYASLLLLELGARVIKIEQPGVGDYYRALFRKGEGLLGDGHVEAINQGKESLGLDLKSPEGREIFLKLVKKADIVVENFRPGVLKKLRLSYEVLKKINRSVILCSVTGFGQKGNQSGLAGHDISYLGLSGLLTKMRDKEGNSVIPEFQIIDLMAGRDAVTKILAALFQRTRTKRGIWIDCAMIESGLSISRLYPPRSSQGQSAGPTPVGGGLIRYGVYETADGKWVTLAALEPKFWSRFCRAIDRTEWIEGAERFEFMGDERREKLRQIFRSKNAREWVELGRSEDLCVFPVVGFQELPLRKQKRAPAMGEHTVKILQSIGYRKNQIKIFKTKGVLE